MKIITIFLYTSIIGLSQSVAQFGMSKEDLKKEYGTPTEENNLKDGTSLIYFKKRGLIYAFILLDEKSEGVEIQKINRNKISLSEKDEFLKLFGKGLPWDVETKEEDLIFYEQSKGGGKARLVGLEKNSNVLPGLLVVSEKYRKWENSKLGN